MFGLLKMPRMAELKNKEYTGFTNSDVDIGKLRIDILTVARTGVQATPFS